jgi:hypothetical protein
VEPGGDVVVTVTGGEVVVTGGEVVVTGGDVVVTVTGGDVVVSGGVDVAGGDVVVGTDPETDGRVPDTPLLAELIALDSEDPAWPFPAPQPANVKPMLALATANTSHSRRTRRTVLNMAALRGIITSSPGIPLDSP